MTAQTLRGLDFRGRTIELAVDLAVEGARSYARSRITMGRFGTMPVVLKKRTDDSPEAKAAFAHEIQMGRRLRRRLPQEDSYPAELAMFLLSDRDDEEATWQLMRARGSRLDTVGQLEDEHEWRQFTESMFRALRWLEYAQVVHRDLTPQNVFWDREQRAVHVIDFGLATVVGTRRSATGVGRSPWASSAQLRGAGNVGFADDVYSAGLLAFQLGTGARERDLPPDRATIDNCPLWVRDSLWTHGGRQLPSSLDVLHRLGCEDIRPPSRNIDPIEVGRRLFDDLAARKQDDRRQLMTRPYDPPSQRSEPDPRILRWAVACGVVLMLLVVILALAIGAS